MADDTTLSPGAGGDSIRDVDKSPGVKGKTQVVVIDMGGSGAEDLTSTPATEATLASIKAKTDNIPAQGQALAAASVPVVLTAIQQAALTPPAAITGFALEAGNLATIAGKDFATSAKQDTGNSSLATIAAKDFATQATLALVATTAKQDTGNASLSSIDGKTPALGQALAAASVPVVMTAAQLATLTPLATAATSASIPPSYTEAASSALSQTLTGDLRTYDKSFNFEMLSETNDLLRILIREMWSLRMGFVRELRDMPDPSELDFHNPENLLN